MPALEAGKTRLPARLHAPEEGLERPVKTVQRTALGVHGKAAKRLVLAADDRQGLALVVVADGLAGPTVRSDAFLQRTVLQVRQLVQQIIQPAMLRRLQMHGLDTGS